MSFSGAYSLDLYCDNAQNRYPDPPHTWQQFPDKFVGRSERDCIRQARAEGWILNTKTRKAVCPNCSKKKREAKHTSHAGGVTP